MKRICILLITALFAQKMFCLESLKQLELYEGIEYKTEIDNSTQLSTDEKEGKKKQKLSEDNMSNEENAIIESKNNPVSRNDKPIVSMEKDTILIDKPIIIKQKESCLSPRPRNSYF